MKHKKSFVPRNISSYDLIMYGVDTKNKKETEEALFVLGIDVEQGVECVECEHATANGQRVNGLYYLGVERSDREWTCSGYASFEARLMAKNDKELIKEIVNMSKGG